MAREGGTLTMPRYLMHADHDPAGGDLVRVRVRARVRVSVAGGDQQRGDEQHEEEERSAADAAGGVARAAPPPQQPPVPERHSRRLEWRYGIRPGSGPGPGPGPGPARSLGTGRGIGAGPSGGVSRDGSRVGGGARLRRDGATSLDRRHGSQLRACVHAQQPRTGARKT
eukprot:scaffold124921_cov59-Phaeocystis_antarctica.AAC.2